MNRKHLASFFVTVSLVFGIWAPALAKPTSTAQTLVIGVDYADPATQQQSQGRWFEYTDFFTRQVTVHTGDTLDFRAAPGSLHVVALAADESVALQVYPVYPLITQDPLPAPGSGQTKIGLGVSQVPITGGSTSGGGVISLDDPYGPPVCGVLALGEAPCTFSGGNDIEVAGANPGQDLTQVPPVPAAVDWNIKINAPPGTYQFFCTLHPGMKGTVTVVADNQPTTTQAQINLRAPVQFLLDKLEGLAVEAIANIPIFVGGAPGTRTYTVKVGASTPGSHVSIDEMLPRQTINLVAGDTVKYVWTDKVTIHNVAFPAGNPAVPSPFGYDCGTTFQGIVPGGPPPIPCVLPSVGFPVPIADPGNAPSGTILTSLTAVVDSGVRLGSAFGVPQSTNPWSVAISSISAPGSYQYECAVHDWMKGTLNVTIR